MIWIGHSSERAKDTGKSNLVPWQRAAAVSLSQGPPQDQGEIDQSDLRVSSFPSGWLGSASYVLWPRSLKNVWSSSSS